MGRGGRLREGCDPGNFPGPRLPAHLAAPEPSTWGRAFNSVLTFSSCVSCSLQTSNGFQGSRSSRLSPTFKPLHLGVPQPVTLSHAPSHCPPDQGPTHDRLTACNPGAGAAGTEEEASHTRSFSVRGSRAMRAGEDSVYLKQVAQGTRRYGTAGLAISWPVLTRQQRGQAAAAGGDVPDFRSASSPWVQSLFFAPSPLLQARVYALGLRTQVTTEQTATKTPEVPPHHGPEMLKFWAFIG